MFMGLIIGPAIIRQLREFQIGQYIREEGPQGPSEESRHADHGRSADRHIAIVVPTLLWADLSNRFVWLVMLSTLAFAAIGFADDYLKVAHRRNLGLTGTHEADAAVASGGDSCGRVDCCCKRMAITRRT